MRSNCVFTASGVVVTCLSASAKAKILTSSDSIGPCEGLEPKARPSLPPLNDRYKMAFWGAEFRFRVNIVGDAGASAPRSPGSHRRGQKRAARRQPLIFHVDGSRGA